MTTNTNALQAVPDLELDLRLPREVIEPIRIPLVVHLLQYQGHTWRKTLINTAQASTQDPTVQADHRNVQRPVDPTHWNGVPRMLLEASPPDADRMGADTKFKIASMVKPFFALVFCIIIEKKLFENLDWDTTVWQWMTRLFGTSLPIHRNGESVIRDDLTLKDALLHKGALPHMNWFLFILDGTFQISDQDFFAYLERAAHSSNSRPKNKEQYVYSNANYILLAMLLVKQVEQAKGARSSIDEVMRTYLFGPLKMNRTSLGDDDGNGPAQDSSIPEANYAKCQRLSSDSSTFTDIPTQRYRDSTAYKITMGTWSCTNDIAKFFNAVFDAESGKEGYLTPQISGIFLEYWEFKSDKASDRGGISLAGRVFGLNARVDDTESLNRVILELTENDEKRLSTPVFNPSPHKADTKDKLGLYCKSGTGDGSSSTVYFHPSTRTLAISLSNTNGPVDVTAPIARYSIRCALTSKAPWLMEDNRLAFRHQIEDLQPRAIQVWSKIEVEDGDFAAWSGSMAPYAGVYRNSIHDGQITITGDTVVYSRLRAGHPEVLTTMRMRAATVTTADGGRQRLLRPFPLHEGTFVNRLTDHRDPRLVVVDSGNGSISLKCKGPAAEEEYIKQHP